MKVLTVLGLFVFSMSLYASTESMNALDCKNIIQEEREIKEVASNGETVKIKTKVNSEN